MRHVLDIANDALGQIITTRDEHDDGQEDNHAELIKTFAFVEIAIRDIYIINHTLLRPLLEHQILA